MRKNLLAPLLALLAVRAGAASLLEVRALSSIPSVPPSVSAAGASALATPTAPFSVPALSAPAALPLPAPASAAAPVAASAPASRPAAMAAVQRGNPSAAAPARDLRGDALFDGAPGRGAASVPTDAEIASLYAAARPGSRAVQTLDARGGFAAIARDVVLNYTFVMTHENVLRGLNPRDGDLQRAAKELMTVADARDNPAARRFLEALGRLQAHQDYATALAVAQSRRLVAAGRGELGAPRRHMPRNDLGSGDYWDMAAGINAGYFILNELEPGTHYAFFDLSPYAVSYLNTTAALKGADAVAREADLLTLRRPERPLAVLRTKNAVAYVPGFEKKLEKMADWIAPGGRLAIQNDPMPGQRVLITEKHAPLALRLLREGWDFSFEFVSAPDAKHELDTLIFTRPKAEAKPRTVAKARALWQEYVKAANAANNRGFFSFR